MRSSNFCTSPRILLLFAVLNAWSVSVHAQNNPEKLNARHFNLNKGVALDGYDPVAYFGGKALKGDAKTSAAYQGVTYYFASADDKAQFVKSPEKYTPQYGGWCAYAMGATGEKVEVDPKTFKIHDGKLYLFYNAYFNNTLKTWNKDERHLKARADANWSNIYK